MNTEAQRKTTVRTRTAKETRTPQTEALTTASATPKAEAPKPKLPPTREAIAKRAYELYLARGKADGHEFEDWIQAERELLALTHRYN